MLPLRGWRTIKAADPLGSGMIRPFSGITRAATSAATSGGPDTELACVGVAAGDGDPNIGISLQEVSARAKLIAVDASAARVERRGGKVIIGRRFVCFG